MSPTWKHKSIFIRSHFLKVNHGLKKECDQSLWGPSPSSHLCSWLSEMHTLKPSQLSFLHKALLCPSLHYMLEMEYRLLTGTTAFQQIAASEWMPAHSTISWWPYGKNRELSIPPRSQGDVVKPRLKMWRKGQKECVTDKKIISEVHPIPPTEFKLALP